MHFTVQSPEPTLDIALEWRDVGWVGAGWGEVCVEEWNEVMGERRGTMEKLSFEVIGRSILFGTEARSNYEFVLSSSNRTSRHQVTSDSDCDPTLWDASADALYGIQTFPSGLKILPPSLRSSPFSISTKALSQCSSLGMSKDILPQFVFNWTFLEPIPEALADVDPNDWSLGSQLVIPSVHLENRKAFPVNEPVTIQV